MRISAQISREKSFVSNFKNLLQLKPQLFILKSRAILVMQRG
jgi:hypothetical protein